MLPPFLPFFFFFLNLTNPKLLNGSVCVLYYDALTVAVYRATGINVKIYIFKNIATI